MHNWRSMDFPMRINKYLAHQGIASRREADALIAAGKVTVNGKRAELGTKITEADKFEIKGKQKEMIYLAYYKGRGVISHSPEEGEVDIATRLEKDFGLTNVYPVGRLDKDSEGLIILTNDGRITAPLLNPESKTEKEYDVTVDKPTNNWFLKHMAEGVKIERYTTKPAKVDGNQKNKLRFRIVLSEGKKHQIRRMCAALGYQVKSLKRVRILHIELGKLKPNQYRKLNPDEQIKLVRALGIQK